MKQLKILSICLLALALHGKAWAEIYETRDAEGNPEFTDSPPSENAEAVDLQQPNIADAPAPDDSQDDAQPGTAAPDQAPVVENNVENNVVIDRDGDGYDDGVYEDGEYVDREQAREADREIRRADPDAPHEVGDSEMQMPREVGDTEAQMPREVGDSEAQMPREVGDMPAQTREGLRR